MIRQLDKPCFEIVCDGCDVGDNAEYESCYHHDSAADAIRSAEDQDWRLTRDESGAVTSVLCSVCVEQGEGETE